MQRTAIEWVINPDGTQGYTHNIITGCFHNCHYCYARKIANRFKMSSESVVSVKLIIDDKYGTLIQLDEPVILKDKIQPFPFEFRPTYHKYRLNDLIKKRKSSTIFIGNMGDMFGEWVLNSQILEIFNVIEKTPHHIYLLLTKNAKRYKEFSFPKNVWLGQTLDMKDSINANIMQLFNLTKNNFISFEPLFNDNIPSINRKLEDIIEYIRPSWIIVGGQTNPNILPEKEWIERIIFKCREMDIPIFLKDNLKPLGIELIQEIPYLKGDT